MCNNISQIAYAEEIPNEDASIQEIKAEVICTPEEDIYTGDEIRLDVNVSQGNGDYQYQFSEETEEGETVLQEFSEKDEYKFQKEVAGIYQYFIDILDGAGKNVRLEYKLEIKEKPVQEQDDFSQLPNGPENTGENTGNDEQQKDKESEENISDSPKNEIIDSDSGDVIISNQEINALQNGENADESELAGTLTSSRSAQVYENRGVKLTAEVTQGNGGYEYQYRESYNGETKIVQEYSETATYTFTTSGVGMHTYYVDIRDAKGKTLTLSYDLRVTEEPGVELQAVLSSSRGNQAYAERGLTLMTTVTQGNGGYEYQYRDVYNGITTVIQEYSSNANCEFTTSGIGQHVYYVDIRDAKNKTLTLSYSFSVTTHPDNVISGTVTSTRGTQVYMNRGVTLTAETQNEGYGECQYRFIDSYNGEERVVQDYSESASYGFTTETVGTHTYYVDIKDRENQIVRLAYTMTVTTEVGKELLVSIESSRTGNVYSNRGIILTASALSGYGEYTYQFTQTYNGYSRVVQEYSEDYIYEFKTGIPGTYQYTVTVKDKSQAEASASLTIQVVSDGSVDYGIDVSKWNGTIDWATVKNQGVEFAMIRTGYGRTGIDEQFENNYSGARAQGIRVGVYHYSYASTEEQARQEAQLVLRILAGRDLDLPVAFDIEDPEVHQPLSKSQATKITVAFCEEIRKAGYTPMVYASRSFFSTHLDYSQLSSYKMWVARWEADNPGVDFQVDMWQYSSEGNVPGANTSGGVCDVNYAFGL